MISVIIPVFNNYKTLSQCLASVFKQTFKNFEVIVVDDGSFDKNQIKKIIDKFDSVKLIQQSNQGAPAARNRGFSAARGDYIIFLDADIKLKPFALDTMLEKLENSKAAYCYSAYRVSWKKHKFIKFDLEKLKKFNYIHTSSLIKRQVFLGFDESLTKFQDWDLWLTLAKNKHYGVGIDKVLFSIKGGRGTMSKWYPKIFYKLPWPIFGYMPRMIKKYFQAREIINKKHNL